jgi:hypothetical protein
MLRLSALALRWLAGKAGLLLLIVAVLLVGGWLRSEWAELRTLREEIATQERLATNLRSELSGIDAALRQESAAWSAQMSAVTWPLRTELQGLEARIARAQPQWQAALRQFADLERQAAEARAAARRAEAELAALERAAWWWDRFVDPAKALALERARAKARILRRSAEAWGAARDRVAPVIEGAPMQALLARESALRARIEALRTAVSPRERTLLEARERKAVEVTQVEALLGAQRERAARDPRQRLLAAIRRQLPLAFGILALALLVPVGIKALFFFVLAPLAGRQPPVRVLPDPAAPQLPPASRSGVSQVIDLAPHEELLVQPEHLQSTGQPASKRTQWLLNPSLPFASLASGLYALTRIAPPPGDAGTRVVVAAHADPLGELAVLELPAGAALVLQPRALAGVVQPAATPLRVTRHWRLASLHAWLTLQLRYLVFHGPCRLVLKGCRGVRAETPRAGEPRLVAQAATLGFSANLDYRTTRSETFVGYLLGRESLLNDLFSGAPGCFVYEEVPGHRRRSGVTGRGLEGVADAVLKAFGI